MRQITRPCDTEACRARRRAHKDLLSLLPTSTKVVLLPTVRYSDKLCFGNRWVETEKFGVSDLVGWDYLPDRQSGYPAPPEAFRVRQHSLTTPTCTFITDAPPPL